MTRTTFKHACAALWGPQYQSEAARQLGIGRSSVVRYDLGDRTVPVQIVERLGELLAERQARIDGLLVKLRNGG